MGFPPIISTLPERRTASLSWCRRVVHRPADDRGCGWIETLPAPPPARRLAGEVEADDVVLGAGFTGLAAARRLAELRPGRRVAVVEAQRAGFGASGRSSGFVVDLVDFVAGLAAAERRGYVTVARLGISTLRRWVEEAEIACDWNEGGWLRGAAGRRGEVALRRFIPLLREFEVRHQLLGTREMEAATGTAFYRSGLHLPGAILVQPAALARGLAAALPPAVDLYEESPVEEIERRGESFALRCAGGSLRARRLFVAANGYTPFLGFARRRIFPLYTFGSLSRPLTPDQQARLGGEAQWGLLAMDPMGSTLRRTRDQRILVRNTVLFSRRPRLAGERLRSMRRAHRRAFEARFPELADLSFEFTWGGLMGTSKSQLCCFGEIEPDLFLAAGYTGAGIAMGTATGRLLADLANGRRSVPLTAQLSLPKPFRMPPEPFRSLGGRWLVGRMNARAGATL